MAAVAVAVVVLVAVFADRYPQINLLHQFPVQSFTDTLALY